MTQKRLLIGFAVFFLIGVPALGILAMIPQQYNSTVSSGSRSSFMMAQTDSVMPAQSAMGRPAMGKAEIMPLPPQYGSDYAPGADRVIVKNASLSLVVDDVRAAVSQITDLVKKENGLVTSSNIYDAQMPSNRLRAELSLRVPSAQLESVLEQIRKIGSKVLSENITAQDRTKQKVDMEAQLKNLRATETQLLAIMKQADTVTETLSVQKELAQVRSQIEVMTAELENLSNDASMAELHVSLATEESNLPVVGSQQRSVREEITLAIKDAVRLYRALFIGGLRSVIILLPLAAIVAVAWFIWQRRAKRV